MHERMSEVAAQRKASTASEAGSLLTVLPLPAGGTCDLRVSPPGPFTLGR
jgi:hypothetical protein